MSRKTARELVLRFLFELDFTNGRAAPLLSERLTPGAFAALEGEDYLYAEFPDQRDLAYITRMTVGVMDHLTELDGYIERYSVGWKFGRISRIVASIMRLSMYEILYMQDVPDSVSINEAVELAKLYDTGDAASFINGILGTFQRQEAPQ